MLTVSSPLIFMQDFQQLVPNRNYMLAYTEFFLIFAFSMDPYYFSEKVLKGLQAHF